MAGWSLATGTYFAFHDDVLTRLIARQKEQQFAYEDRIAELRAQVDRITSRQLLDQEQFEQKLDQIMRRQATLESRASTLAGVPDPTPTGSIKRRPTPMAEPPRRRTPKPSPISDTVIFTAPPDREARLESRELPAAARRCRAAPSRRSRRRGRAGAAASLARPRRGAADRDAQHARGALRRQGQAHARRAGRSRHGCRESRPRRPAGVGGPFVPVTLPQGRRRVRAPALSHPASRAPTSTG